MKNRKNNPLKQLPIPPENYGTIEIKLDKLIEDRGVSLNQLSFRSEVQRSQLRKYRDNKIQRIDIDLVMRLCYVLDCSFYELIHYRPPIEE